MLGGTERLIGIPVSPGLTPRARVYTALQAAHGGTRSTAEVRRLIQASRGTRHQVMNVSLSSQAKIAALFATSVIASEYNGPHVAPMLFTSIGARR